MAMAATAAMVVTTLNTERAQQTLAPLAASFDEPGILLTVGAD
jgi:isopentenyl diphosphate isomerase/L-lactate dehydrogenase-like FMN-dependent dehydrogenase